MNENLMSVGAIVMGFVLGALFFGGLWWGVRQGVSSRHPTHWFLGSALARMSLVLAGFCFVGRECWERLLLCLLGFVAARFLVMRITRAPTECSRSMAQEENDAP